MTQSERKTQTVQFQSWEVGGELLDILSRGLYSDAKDALREYVQNGVDAKARNIIITVDGSRAVIRDDGTGMDLNEMRDARRFGLSAKSPMQAVGFRGIGIYSAFGICEEMTISSRQEGMSGLVGWRFRFGEMRRLLESDKSFDIRQGIGLPGLMLEYTELFEEPYRGSPDDHFTVVELEGIDEEYRAQLNDASEVNNYLLNTVPVAFGTEGYGGTVNGWLVDHVDLNPVRVTLRIADEVDIDVLPPVAASVYRPEIGWINHPDGTPMAFVWYALSTNGRQIPSQDEGTMVSGFLLKMKGFTLGRRDLLKPLWPATGGRSLYHHYTGEVHLLDSGRLYPNAARDDLESNPGKQLFEKQLSDFFYPMSRKARAMQARARAERLLDSMEGIVAQLRIEKDAPDADSFEVYRKAVTHHGGLENVHAEIERHMRATRGRPKPRFDVAQQEALEDALKGLEGWMVQLNQVKRSAHQRTEKQKQQTKQPPPQSDLLRRTLEAVEALSEDSGEPRLKGAVAELQPHVKSVAMARAVGVLDELKADGIELDSDVETCRKELRVAVGWSAEAPVSLEEALVQHGVNLEADEESLVRAIDRGLVAGLGGRGEAYEAVLRAIADSVAEEREV